MIYLRTDCQSHLDHGQHRLTYECRSKKKYDHDIDKATAYRRNHYHTTVDAMDGQHCDVTINNEIPILHKLNKLSDNLSGFKMNNVM